MSLRKGPRESEWREGVSFTHRWGTHLFWLVWPVPKLQKFTGVGSRAQQKSQGLAGKALAWEGSQGTESREGCTSSSRLVTHQFWLVCPAPSGQKFNRDRNRSQQRG